MEAELQNYCIYYPHRERVVRGNSGEATFANTFAPLNEMNESIVEQFCFDGTICFDGKSHRVERVPFDILSIGRYEDIGEVSVGTDIWIQSQIGERVDIWYRLGEPGKS